MNNQLSRAQETWEILTSRAKNHATTSAAPRSEAPMSGLAAPDDLRAQLTAT